MNGLPDEISLVNDALALFGAGAISSFDEETELASVCARLYPATVDAVLTARDWKHLNKTAPLQRLAETPQNGFAHAYAPPKDAFGPPRRLLSQLRPPLTLRDFAIEGATVCADAPQLWGTYGRRLSPDQWTPALRLCLTYAVAAALCVPVSEDKDMAARLETRAFGVPQMQGQGGLFAEAICADHAAAPGQPPLLAEVSPLSGGYSTYPADWFAA